MELIGERKQQVTGDTLQQQPHGPHGLLSPHPLRSLPLPSTCSGTVHAVIYEVDISKKLVWAAPGITSV